MISAKGFGRVVGLAIVAGAGALALLVGATAGYAAWTSWRLPRSDARSAVAAAIARGDFRLYAWEGNGVAVPGLSGAAYEEALSSPCALRWLAVTDRVRPWVWGRADASELAFAARYNRLMIAEPRRVASCRPAA